MKNYEKQNFIDSYLKINKERRTNQCSSLFSYVIRVSITVNTDGIDLWMNNLF